MHLYLVVYYCCFVITALVNQIYGYKRNTALQDIVFMNDDDDEPADVHSVYFFGTCTSRHKKIVYYENKTYENLQDKVFISGMLPGIEREPRCVQLRARSSYDEQVRYHAYKFNICIYTVTYNYRNTKVEHIYYEWLFPVEMKKNIKWEIIFYE